LTVKNGLTFMENSTSGGKKVNPSILSLCPWSFFSLDHRAPCLPCHSLREKRLSSSHSF
jgi:hypothetical protein